MQPGLRKQIQTNVSQAIWVAILSGSQSEITLGILSNYNMIYYLLLSSKNLCCNDLTLLL